MWYSADLAQRLELASSYIAGMLDKDKQDEPFFHITRREDGTAFAGHAIEIGIPHVTGRALDALLFTEETLKRPAPEPATGVYIRYLYSCFDNPDHLPSYYDPRQDGKRFVEFHNMREGLEGLYWLIKLRDDARARTLAHQMLETLDSITAPEGGYSLPLVEKIGRKEIFRGIGAVQTVSSGRLIGPLMKYYRLTGDALALKLAANYSRYVSETAFTAEGLLTDLAGNHIHSITSTLSGLLDYALCTKDEALVKQVEQVYKVGLREFYSTYGWCKEQAWLETDQGEVNQIGDLIQVQLALAAARNPAYYAEAEHWMRGGLLPSQVLENTFVVDNPEPKGDFERDIPARMIGGFGFPTPSAHLQTGHSPINTIDITEGAVQALCEFTHHIITRTELGIQVNLLFSWENELAKVESELPLKGKLTITVKQPLNLLVRIPENFTPGSLEAEREGEAISPQRTGNYLLLPNSQAGATFEVTFAPIRFAKSEFVYHQPYEVQWFGEQAVGISPQKGIYPLFGEWPGP